MKASICRLIKSQLVWLYMIQYLRFIYGFFYWSYISIPIILMPGSSVQLAQSRKVSDLFLPLSLQIEILPVYRSRPLPSLLESFSADSSCPFSRRVCSDLDQV